MKFNTLILSSSIVLLSACASTDLGSIAGMSSESAKSALSETVNSVKENLLADYAAKQLGLPKDKATAALGAVFKTAQGNLSADDFLSLGKSIPGLDSLIEKAPALASSLGGGKANSGASLGYLDAAFKKIGIPKETVLPLVGTLTQYLDQNNMGTASALLKKGLNFL